jgi:hypothetical protein
MRNAGGQQDLRWSNLAPAIEVEYGRRDSTDLRFVDYLVPGYDRGLVTTAPIRLTLRSGS